MRSCFKTLKIVYFSIADVLLVVEPCQLSMSFVMKLWTSNLMVPWLFGLVALAWLMLRCVHSRRRRRHDGIVWVERLTSMFLLAIKLMYPGLGAIFFSAMQCRTLGDGKRHLNLEPQTLCEWSSKEYIGLVMLSALGIALYIVGIPLLLQHCVRADRRRMKSDQFASEAEDAKIQSFTPAAAVSVASRMRRSARMLVRRRHLRSHKALQLFVAAYKDKYWWWFLVEV